MAKAKSPSPKGNKTKTAVPAKSAGGVKSAKAKSDVSKSVANRAWNKGALRRALDHLTRDQLSDMCYESYLRTSGPKTDLIHRLIDDGFWWDDLLVEELKDILAARDRTYSGMRKSELISSVKRSDFYADDDYWKETNDCDEPTSHSECKKGAREDKIVKKWRERSHKLQDTDPASTKTAGFVAGSMSPETYKNRLGQAGIVLHDDQHVFHIIARANGGADHSDNYHFGQGKSFNCTNGSSQDAIHCYLVGLSKATKAVAASRMIKKYSGPSAEELYERGKFEWQTMLKTKKLWDN